ncbi:MAG: efflux RND transporter periplasmic adaptor subunit [Pseudomonadota bacterium]
MPSVPTLASCGRRSFTALVITSCSLLAGCSLEDVLGGPGGSREAPPPPAVTVATPLVEQIVDWDEYTGRLAAIDRVEVRARVSGYLDSSAFDEGQFVAEGDPLFVVDPRPYQAVLDAAEAERKRAQSALDLARIELDRAERLLRSNAGSAELRDTRSAEFQQATAALEAAVASVASARLDVQFTTVRAPIAGRVGRKLVTEGNLVTGGASGATLLTTIVSLDPVHFYFTADESAYLKYARLAREGKRPSSRTTANPVQLKLADEASFVHEGRMDFVDNEVDQATGTIQGRAIFDNADQLLTPGLFARIRLLGRGPYEALLVPEIAIGADQSRRFVFVLSEDELPERRYIELGRTLGDMRIVASGITPEDRVIVNGVQRVRGNSPVTVENTELAPLDPAVAGRVGSEAR